MACQSASSGILPTTQGKQAVEKPAELALLLSEQPRHAKTPTSTKSAKNPCQRQWDLDPHAGSSPVDPATPGR